MGKSALPPCETQGLNSSCQCRARSLSWLNRLSGPVLQIFLTQDWLNLQSQDCRYGGPAITYTMQSPQQLCEATLILQCQTSQERGPRQREVGKQSRGWLLAWVDHKAFSRASQKHTVLGGHRHLLLVWKMQFTAPLLCPMLGAALPLLTLGSAPGPPQNQLLELAARQHACQSRPRNEGGLGGKAGWVGGSHARTQAPGHLSQALD